VRCQEQIGTTSQAFFAGLWKILYEKVHGMKPYEFGDENKLAGVGFFLSLVGVEVMCLLLYFGQGNYRSLRFVVPYLIIVPLIQVTGLVSSIKSTLYIEEWGDKDFAQGGLFLNTLFLSLYILSLIYFFGWVWIPNY